MDNLGSFTSDPADDQANFTANIKKYIYLPVPREHFDPVRADLREAHEVFVSVKAIYQIWMESQLLDLSDADRQQMREHMIWAAGEMTLLFGCSVVSGSGINLDLYDDFAPAIGVSREELRTLCFPG